MIDFLKDVIEGLLLALNSSCHHYVFLLLIVCYVS